MTDFQELNESDKSIKLQNVFKEEEGSEMVTIKSAVSSMQEMLAYMTEDDFKKTKVKQLETGVELTEYKIRRSTYKQDQLDQQDQMYQLDQELPLAGEEGFYIDFKRFKVDIHEQFEESTETIPESLESDKDNSSIEFIKEDIIQLTNKMDVLKNYYEEQTFLKGNCEEIQMTDDANDELNSKALAAIKEGKQIINEFLRWGYRLYRSKYSKYPQKNKIRQKTRREIHKIKYDIKRLNRVEGELENLPEVSNQTFLMTPYQDNTPKDCFEVFHTGCLFLGKANVLGMNEHGTYVMPNGAVYVGNFKNNMFHGMGRIIYPNKIVVKGIWIFGTLIKYKLVFPDGLLYNGQDWSYLRPPKRRYPNEKISSPFPDNCPQLAVDHPARIIPKGCYDNGEGFFSIKTMCLYHPVTGAFIRIPTRKEANWIIENCRCSDDVNRDRLKKKPLSENRDESLLNSQLLMKQTLPKSNYNLIHQSKALRKEIIKSMDKQSYLTLKELENLSVSLLKNDPISNSTEVTNTFSRHRYITRELLENLPKSVIKLLSNKININYACPGDDESMPMIDIINFYTNQVLKFKHFIRILIRINDFINGKDEHWTDKLEMRIRHCLQILQSLEVELLIKSEEFKRYIGIEETDILGDKVMKLFKYWMKNYRNLYLLPDLFDMYKMRKKPPKEQIPEDDLGSYMLPPDDTHITEEDQEASRIYASSVELEERIKSMMEQIEPEF